MFHSPIEGNNQRFCFHHNIEQFISEVESTPKFLTLEWKFLNRAVV